MKTQPSIKKLLIWGSVMTASTSLYANPSTGFLENPEAATRERNIGGVGLILFGMPKDGILFGNPKQSLFASNDLRGWNPQLRYSDGTGDSIGKAPPNTTAALRIQRNIHTVATNAKGALYQFISDGESGMDTINFNAAAVVDIYTPGIGPESSWFGRYDPDEYAFHFRLGVQWDKSSVDGMDQRDVREFFVGANTLAPNLLPARFFKASDANQMDIGFRYRDDRITGESNSSFVLQWKPAYKALFGREITAKQILQYFGTGSVEGTKNLDVDPGTSGLEVFRKTQSSNWRFSFQPTFEFEYFLDEEYNLQTDRDFSLNAGLELSTTFFDGLGTLSYKGVAEHDFGSNDTHLHHSINATWRLAKDSPLSIEADYEWGEIAPSYQKVDLFTVGLGLKF